MKTESDALEIDAARRGNVNVKKQSCVTFASFGLCENKNLYHRHPQLYHQRNLFKSCSTPYLSWRTQLRKDLGQSDRMVGQKLDINHSTVSQIYCKYAKVHNFYDKKPRSGRPHKLDAVILPREPGPLFRDPR